MLTFCLWLVSMKIFEKVTLSFLLQGHTHEDVDQLFVGMATKYKHSILWNLEDLMRVIPSAYSSEPTRPKAIYTNLIFNWKEFFDPVLVSLVGHSGPHVFIFGPNNVGDVVMQHKNYHSSINLLRGGQNGDGLVVISALPQGVPQLVQRKPYAEADMTAIKNLFNMPGFPDEAKVFW